MAVETFQLNKLRRLIRTQGKPFLFRKQILNKFNEPDGYNESVTIIGVFHELALSWYKSKDTNEATSISKRASPMVMILWDEVELIKGDVIVEFNNNTYRVCNINNIGECNLVADVSLEEVLT